MIFRPVTLPEALGLGVTGGERERVGTGCCDPSRISYPQKDETEQGGARRGLDQPASLAAGSGRTLEGRDDGDKSL